jgi:hypothetical protein
MMGNREYRPASHPHQAVFGPGPYEVPFSAEEFVFSTKYGDYAADYPKLARCRP